MKNFLSGMFTLVCIILGILFTTVLLLLLSYGSGWVLGWMMNCILNFDIIFGIDFEQLFGLVSVFTTFIITGIACIIGSNNKRIEKRLVTKFKEYRGY